MSASHKWTKDVYESSVSSRCWDYTSYNDGWNGCPDIAADGELRGIVGMEMDLVPIPEWVQQIVEKSINFAPPCGHYLFPRGFLEVIDTIGGERAPGLIHSCFAAAPDRKREAMDYCLCMDAWLAGASPESPARELAALGQRKADWHAICRDLWEVLGERSELKELLVERTLHQVRNCIKAGIWEGDIACRCMRDQYTGDYVESGGPGEYSNRDLTVPDFAESASPRVQRITSRIAELSGDPHLWAWDWWICAPKAFRYLEKRLWSIGAGHPAKSSKEVAGFLQCEDTYPDQDQAAAWWRSFCEALDCWWQGRPTAGAVADDAYRRLGKDTPMKRWLVRLFLRKIRRLEQNDEEFTRLVNPPPHAKRGSRPVP